MSAPLITIAGRTVRAAAFALVLLASSSSASARLLARWSFNESNAGVIHDPLNTYPGVISPTGASIVPGGISGNALSLSKSGNGYVDFGNVLPLTNMSFTIIAWIKMNPGDATDSSVILGKQFAGYENGYILNANTSLAFGKTSKAFFYAGSIYRLTISTSSVNDGAWHQIVAVYDYGKTSSIYVDGAPAEDTKAVLPVIPTAADLLVGGVLMNGQPTGLFTGLIDEVRVYDTVLSDSDIDFLYRNPADDLEIPGQPLAIESFAGSTYGTNDGFRIDAKFNLIPDMKFDRQGNLWVIDSNFVGYDQPGPDPYRLRIIDPTGSVRAFAGSTFGTNDGPASAAKFGGSAGMAFDSKGNAFVADRLTHRIRKVDPSGFVTTFAGSARGYKDGIGTDAQFNLPMAVAIDASDNLYVADWFNVRVRKITPDGTVTTFAGSTQGNANGPGQTAQFGGLTDIGIGPSGALYIADWANSSIRKIDPGGMVTTFASGLNYVENVSVDEKENVYASVRNQLVKFNHDGARQWDFTLPSGFQDGPIAQAKVNRFGRVLTDGPNRLLFADLYRIRTIELAPAILSISVAPSAITVSQNQSIVALVNLAGAGNLMLSAGSDNQLLVPNANLSLSSSGTVRTLTILPNSNANNTNSGGRGANITVRVTDPNGDAASATLTVNVLAGPVPPAPPVLSQIPEQITTRNQSTQPAPFMAVDPENPGAPLVITAASSNQDLVTDDHIFMGGAGMARSIYVTPNFNAQGNAAIMVTARNPANNLSSSITFNISVGSSSHPPAADFDGDGFPDLILEDNDGFIGAWSMSGATAVKGYYLDPSRVGDPNWRVAGVGDFNEDGKPDLLFQHANGTLAVWYMNGFQLNAAAYVSPSNPSDPNWRAIAVADINNDGKPDILFQHEDGSLGVWLMDGITLSSAQLFSPNTVGDPNWKLAGAGDFNSDHKIDLVFQHLDGSLAVWLMDGLNLVQGVLLNPITPGDPNWRVVSVTDLDRDQNSDLIFQNSSDRSVEAWFMKGSNLRASNLLNPANPRGTWRILAP